MGRYKIILLDDSRPDILRYPDTVVDDGPPSPVGHFFVSFFTSAARLGKLGADKGVPAYPPPPPLEKRILYPQTLDDLPVLKVFGEEPVRAALQRGLHDQGGPKR